MISAELIRVIHAVRELVNGEENTGIELSELQSHDLIQGLSADELQSALSDAEKSGLINMTRGLGIGASEANSIIHVDLAYGTPLLDFLKAHPNPSLQTEQSN